MKKSLLFAAALATAFAGSAEVFDYGFATENNPAMPFLNEMGNPESEYYASGNVDFIKKEGIAMPNWANVKIINTPVGADKGVLDLGLCISMLDGEVYKLTPDATTGDEVTEYELRDMPAENYNYPFLSWGPKGVTRTIFMAGWGSEDAYVDDNYNAATEADWVATKNGFQFTRLGTEGIVSREDTYFQFPAVTGNVTVTVWAGTNLGGTANPDNKLEVLVTPIVDGVADTEKAVVLSKADPVTKRYYKLDPITFDATGKSVAFQVGANGAQLNLMHVRIEGEKASAGIENIIAGEVENADAPVYNVLGQRVNENYKGLVIKNGKKYIQK